MTVLSLTGSPSSTCMTDEVYVTAHAYALVVWVACLALSGPRGDRPVNRGGHQVTTSAACPAVKWAVERKTLVRTDRRLDGCGADESTCSWISWTSDISLCAVLSSTGNAGSSLIRSVWFSIIWTRSKSLLATSVWSAGRRSKGDNRIRWSRSSPS